METEIKYFNIPIPLLRGLLTGEKRIKDFIQESVNYSLYDYAMRLPETDEDGTNMATQIKAAANFLNVRLGNINHVISAGENLYRLYGNNGAFAGVRTSIVWDYNENQKSEHQIALFCAYCATKSILGKGKFKRTGKQHIIARMFGYNTYTEFVNDHPITTAKNISKEVRVKRQEAADCRAKYSKRYHIDKILTDLELDWGFKRYGNHIRGMYISYVADLSELAKACEDSKRSIRENALREAKNLAREQAKRTAP